MGADTTHGALRSIRTGEVQASRRLHSSLNRREPKPGLERDARASRRIPARRVPPLTFILYVTLRGTARARNCKRWARRSTPFQLEFLRLRSSGFILLSFLFLGHGLSGWLERGRIWSNRRAVLALATQAKHTTRGEGLSASPSSLHHQNSRSCRPCRAHRETVMGPPPCSPTVARSRRSAGMMSGLAVSFKMPAPRRCATNPPLIVNPET